MIGAAIADGGRDVGFGGVSMKRRSFALIAPLVVLACGKTKPIGAGPNDTADAAAILPSTQPDAPDASTTSAADAAGEPMPPSGAADAGAVEAPDAAHMMSNGCSDLFRQDVVQTYEVEISADEWAKLQHEFEDLANVPLGMEQHAY